MHLRRSNSWSLSSSQTLFAVIACLHWICLAQALECYVCKNQENNKDKCVETVKTCDISDDRCLTEVRWGSTPYWAPSGEKQYYISKRCATKSICDESKTNLTRRCDRIWYNDWECIECCNGDKCNYYVTLNAKNIQFSGALMLSTVLLIYINKRWLEKMN